MYLVRIWFRWQGEQVYEDLGPYDRWLAELVTVSMADGYTFGITHVHVEAALMIPTAIDAARYS